MVLVHDVVVDEVSGGPAVYEGFGVDDLCSFVCEERDGYSH